MSKPLLIIAAGGTGGHMFPAQALAEAMLERGWEVHLSTDARGARYAGAFPQAVRRDVLASATFARGGALAKLMVPLRIGAGVVRATLSMLARRPQVVVGFGGYPSIPALSAAWALRVPRMLHEQNGVLGKVNRVFAPRVTRLACGTWPTALPQGVEGTPTGNPVRAAVLAQAGAPYEAPGETGPLRLVMIGGSQGARILSQTVPAALALLPEALKARIEIAHQARPEDAEAVTAAYEAAGITADVQSFLDVPALFARAHLVISRAGASSLADLTVIGRPGILVPYAVAAGDHQTANARGLIEAGAAVMLPEPDFTPERLCDEIVSILQQPERAAQMAHSAKGLGRPDATDRLVALVDEISAQTEKQ